MLGFRDADLLRKTLLGEVRRFSYSIPVTSVSAAATLQATIPVEQASDFICDTITGRVYFDSGIEINREVDFFLVQMPRIEVIDTASGASLFDRSDVNFDNFWGIARDPLVLSQPHLFEAKTVIVVIIVNPSSTALRLQVAFHGYKQYRRSA